MALHVEKSRDVAVLAARLAWKDGQVKDDKRQATEAAMPFDGTCNQDASVALTMLVRLNELMDGGKGWIRGRLFDRCGRFCLLGGLQHLSAMTGLSAAPAEHYLKLVIGHHADIWRFNDTRERFEEIQDAVLDACEAARRAGGVMLDVRPSRRRELSLKVIGFWG